MHSFLCVPLGRKWQASFYNPKLCFFFNVSSFTVLHTCFRSLQVVSFLPAVIFIYIYFFFIVLTSQRKNLDFPYRYRHPCSHASPLRAFASCERDSLSQGSKQAAPTPRPPSPTRAGGVRNKSKCTAWRQGPTGKQALRLCPSLRSPPRRRGGGSFLPHPPLPSPSLAAGERFPYAREQGRGAGGSLIAGAGGDVRRSGGWHGAGWASERSEIEADKSLGDVEGAVIHGRENRGAPSPPPSIGDGRERERRRGERACAGGAGGRHFWWMV